MFDRRQLAEMDARNHGRHSGAHLIHDTTDENIEARLAIGERIAHEIVNSEAFLAVGRDPWDGYQLPRHAVPEPGYTASDPLPVAEFLGFPFLLDPDLPPGVIRISDGQGGFRALLVWDRDQ